MSNYDKLYNELSESSQTTSSSKEPNWMMCMSKGDDAYYTTSSISEEASKTLGNFCYIYDHQFSLKRGIEMTPSHTIKPDGGLTAQDLRVIVPSSSLNSTVNLAFFENTEIKSVKLARVGILSNKYDILEEYTFSSCFITGIVTKGDILALSFRYASIERQNTAYNQSGVKGGSHGAIHNFTTAHSSAPA